MTSKEYLIDLLKENEVFLKAILHYLQVKKVIIILT